MSGLLTAFILSLLLTLIFEFLIAVVFKIRGKDLLLVVLVNILTNPAAVLLSLFGGNERIVQLVIEVMVILTEGWYYKKYSSRMKNGFIFSAVANTVSYTLGIILSYIHLLI